MSVVVCWERDLYAIDRAALPRGSLLASLADCRHCKKRHHAPHRIYLKQVPRGIDTLDVYTRWLRTGRIWLPGEKSIFCHWHDLFLLWLAGQDLRDVKFQNHIMDILLVMKEGLGRSLRKVLPLPEPKDIGFVYEKTPRLTEPIPLDPLREYLVELFTDNDELNIRLDLDIRSLNQEYGEFLTELSAMAELRREEPWSFSGRAKATYRVREINACKTLRIFEIRNPFIKGSRNARTKEQFRDSFEEMVYDGGSYKSKIWSMTNR